MIPQSLVLELWPLSKPPTYCISAGTNADAPLRLCQSSVSLSVWNMPRKNGAWLKLRFTMWILWIGTGHRVLSVQLSHSLAWLGQVGILGLKIRGGPASVWVAQSCALCPEGSAGTQSVLLTVC